MMCSFASRYPEVFCSLERPVWRARNSPHCRFCFSSYQFRYQDLPLLFVSAPLSLPYSCCLPIPSSHRSPTYTAIRLTMNFAAIATIAVLALFQSAAAIPVADSPSQDACGIHCPHHY
ncbi:hypothetical protein FRB93_013994 [Tulasnella sp. JGI-2019a]|nr:hypothetical protein FRB93_013994 [Tulasnella sp. JGI-2019a]